MVRVLTLLSFIAAVILFALALFGPADGGTDVDGGLISVAAGFVFRSLENGLPRL